MTRIAHMKYRSFPFLIAAIGAIAATGGGFRMN